MNSLIRNRLTQLFSLAIVLRALFFFFGAEIYYSTSTFYIGGDTGSFITPIKNLIENGIFSGNLNHPDAVFGRLPGYPFFLAPFYLLFKDTLTFYMAVCWTQIILDAVSCCLLYKIVLKVFKQQRMATIASLLYACYPFVIVWTPIVYAETLGILLMLSGVYLTVKDNFKRPLVTGVCLALAFFVRPQLLFLLPAFAMALLLVYRKQALYKIALMVLGFLLVYSPWPIRNYVNHGKFIPMRDITSMRSWQNDVLYFHKYINALQAGWEPQMTQLIQHGPIEFPEQAYITAEDSLLIEKAVHLSRTCSDGFASFMGKPPLKNNCTAETAALWQELLDRQISEDPVNYFVTVPLKGLKKGLFKISLVSNWKSPDRASLETVLITLLFGYRSLLLLIGIAGIIIALRDRAATTLTTIVLVYFVSWYGWLCFVTRYLEMRYFLPADVLMLIPAAYLLHKLTQRFASSPEA
jgi:hypothetical protein